MKKRHPSIVVSSLAVITAFAVIGPQRAFAQEDPAHAELRTLRADVIAAINSKSIDATILHVHPDVVVTWQNNEVCRGHAGLREFFDRMGKDAFKAYKVDPTPDELTILYDGDTGISFGKSVATYELLGKEFEFNNRWTATLIKEDGKWLLAAYHVSLNALDNPILAAAKTALIPGAAAGLVAGGVLGFLVGRRKKGKA